MLAKLALLFLAIMALIVMIFGRPRKGDRSGRGARGGLFSRRGKPPDPRPDQRADPGSDPGAERDRDRDA